MPTTLPLHQQISQIKFNPVGQTLKDISAARLLSSCWRVFWRVNAQQGAGAALRVVPIIRTIIVAVRGFARYHSQEQLGRQQRSQSHDNDDIEESILSKAECEDYRKLGAWLRSQLHSLGPTFIKIGQTLSTRADLLPLPAMLELACLQEEVEPYPSKIAFETITKAFGKEPSRLYAHFDPNPIAAASLSQAYRAVLHDGRDVVVKVQRPNLAITIARDIQILEAVADEVMRYPSLCRHTNWPGVVEEFARTTFEEIDYIREGRNADRFRHNFRNNTRIYIPRIIWRLTGRKVLTIEYVPGVRVTSVETMASMGIDRREVTKSGANFYLRQLLEDGFFHADPHPGNIRIMPDGRVGIFDFGMVGVISPALKRNLVSAFLHVVGQKHDELVDDFIALGFLPEDVDKQKLTSELAPIVEARFAQGLNRVRFAKVLFAFSEVVWRYPFRLPTEFTYIMRALLTLEGVALTIDPDFNFIESALPFAQRLMLKTSGQAVRQAILKEVFSQGRFNARSAINLFKAATRLSKSNEILAPAVPEN